MIVSIVREKATFDCIFTLINNYKSVIKLKEKDEHTRFQFKKGPIPGSR